MSLKEIQINKNEIRVFTSFEESDDADRTYWHSKTPAERLEALELMRQSSYGYEHTTTRRLQRVLEIVKEE